MKVMEYFEYNVKRLATRKEQELLEAAGREKQLTGTLKAAHPNLSLHITNDVERLKTKAQENYTIGIKAITNYLKKEVRTIINTSYASYFRKGGNKTTKDDFNRAVSLLNMGANNKSLTGKSLNEILMPWKSSPSELELLLSLLPDSERTVARLSKEIEGDESNVLKMIIRFKAINNLIKEVEGITAKDSVDTLTLGVKFSELSALFREAESIGKEQEASGDNNDEVVNMTKEEFMNLSYAKRANILATDPELYQRLMM